MLCSYESEPWFSKKRGSICWAGLVLFCFGTGTGMILGAESLVLIKRKRKKVKVVDSIFVAAIGLVKTS